MGDGDSFVRPYELPPAHFGCAVMSFQERKMCRQGQGVPTALNLARSAGPLVLPWRGAAPPEAGRVPANRRSGSSATGAGADDPQINKDLIQALSTAARTALESIGRRRQTRSMP